jgi:hypothetical protein
MHIALFSRRLCHYRHSTQAVTIFSENSLVRTKCHGVTPDSDQTHRKHLSCITRRQNCRLKELFPILNKSSNVDNNSALIISKSLIRSILTYASHHGGNAAKNYINKLQLFQINYSDNNKVTEPEANRILTRTDGNVINTNHIRKLARTLYKMANTGIRHDEWSILGCYDVWLL